MGKRKRKCPQAPDGAQIMMGGATWDIWSTEEHFFLCDGMAKRPYLLGPPCRNLSEVLILATSLGFSKGDITFMSMLPVLPRDRDEFARAVRSMGGIMLQ